MLNIPVSIGELVDKITILRIKQEHLHGAALANVNREHALLEAILHGQGPALPGELCRQLESVNRRLWSVEDAIRACEARGQFDAHFVALARQVYTLNDQRAELKRTINRATGSDLLEEKSYGSFNSPEGPDDPPPH